MPESIGGNNTLKQGLTSAEQTSEVWNKLWGKE